MSFMTKIKAKYILRIAERLATSDPVLAQDLKMLVAGATNPPHPRPTITLGSITSALHVVVDKLNKEKIVFALAGGLATKYWVDIRETLDVDLVLHTDEIEKVKSMFPGGRDLPLMYTVRIDGTDIDFLKGDLFAWIESALQSASEETSLGIKLKIIHPEYLILFKLLAGRERDVNDIKGLLSLTGVAEKARLLVNRYMSNELEDLEQMIREVEYGV
jgi:hypothetical protein